MLDTNQIPFNIIEIYVISIGASELITQFVVQSCDFFGPTQFFCVANVKSPNKN